MNRYKLSKAGIDANQGIWRFSGNKEEYERCLNSFRADTHFEQMLSAIEAQDVKSAFSAAHAIKGMAGNLSMNALYESIIPLLEVFRADTFDGMEPHLTQVKADYQRVMDALRTETE